MNAKREDKAIILRGSIMEAGPLSALDIKLKNECMQTPTQHFFFFWAWW